MKEHIPKKCGDLEKPIVNRKEFDNTHERIHGQEINEVIQTSNKDYGNGRNAADEMPKAGKRQDILDQKVKMQKLS